MIEVGLPGVRLGNRTPGWQDRWWNYKAGCLDRELGIESNYRDLFSKIGVQGEAGASQFLDEIFKIRTELARKVVSSILVCWAS